MYYEWKDSWLSLVIISIMSRFLMASSFHFKCLFEDAHGIVIDQRVLLCKKCLG